MKVIVEVSQQVLKKQKQKKKVVAITLPPQFAARKSPAHSGAAAADNRLSCKHKDARAAEAAEVREKMHHCLHKDRFCGDSCAKMMTKKSNDQWNSSRNSINKPKPKHTDRQTEWRWLIGVNPAG